MKRGELKSLVDIPKLPPALGNRMLQNMKSFESMRRRSQIEFLPTTAGFYHPVEVGRKKNHQTSQGRQMVKVHIFV